jgi:hypothetical protein
MRPTICNTLLGLKPAPPIVPDKIIVLNQMPSRKEIVVRFLTLPHHKREGVLKDLDLVIFGGNDTERYTEAFRTMNTTDRLEALVREIEKAERCQ